MGKGQAELEVRQREGGNKCPGVCPWIIPLHSSVDTGAGVRSHKGIEIPAAHSKDSPFTHCCTEVTPVLRGIMDSHV